MAWYNVAIGVGSLVVSAFGSYKQYQGQKDQQDSATEVSDFNARIEEQTALQVEAESAENSRRMRREAKRIVSGQRAAFGGSGSQVNTGSPLEVQAESAALLERAVLDEDRLRRIEARRLRSSAVSLRLGGQALASGFGSRATGTLLGGAANFFGGTANLLQNSKILGGGSRGRLPEVSTGIR